MKIVLIIAGIVGASCLLIGILCFFGVLGFEKVMEFFHSEDKGGD